MKKSFILFLPLLLIFSCVKNEEANSSSTEKEEGKKQFSQEITDVSDKIGIIREAFAPIAAEWKAAESSNDKLDNTSISFREDYIVVIENNAITKERLEVDIRNLDKDNIRLVDEEEGSGFPGFAIGTIGYKNLIKRFEDEKMVKEENEIIMLFKDRDAVGKVLPILVQNINVANGALDEYLN